MQVYTYFSTRINTGSKQPRRPAPPNRGKDHIRFAEDRAFMGGYTDGSHGLSP